MTVNYIYIHLDTISNSVFSKGLNITDFDYSVTQKPENLLLLDTQTTDGEIEPHTGLRMIRGNQQVIAYFERKKLNPPNQLKWIDFKNFHLLQQLSSMEIAEILYFGHMTTQLHSPFFYKLQNNYAYFEKKDQVAKVYYRYLEDFYKLTEMKLQKNVAERINERRGFF